MSWIDFVGYLAALTVLATFCMDTIVPLRGWRSQATCYLFSMELQDSFIPSFCFTRFCFR
jgi:hypothetical protein